MIQSPSRRAASSRFAVSLAAPSSGVSRQTSAVPQKTVVSLQQVTKLYEPDIVVLDNVNLSVKSREFVFVTGASGAGKSTLLRLLYGAESITSGQVTVADVNLSRLRRRSLAMMRRRIGVVFQDYKLLPSRTVAENVAFVLRAQGLSRQEVKRRLAPALKMVGLLDKAERFPNELSGGGTAAGELGAGDRQYTSVAAGG